MTEFCILPCAECKKTPTINKDSNRTDDKRYTLSHCQISVHAKTETQCIVNWNKLQQETSDESND